MSSIQDHLFDTEFLDQSLQYLGEVLNLQVTIQDSDGQAVLTQGQPGGRASRFYPFSFSQDIGGLTCTAADQEALAACEPHIAYCLAALNSQLAREEELRETSEEMLALSSQLNFLSKVARKIIGVEDLEECYQIILQEISLAINADQSLIHTRGRWDDEVEVRLNITREEEAALLECDCLRRRQDTGHPIICTLDNGKSLLYLPIREKDNRISGRMFFLRPANQRQFTAYEKKFVGIIENIISPTFETLRLYDSLQDLYLNTVKALAAAIDAKDEYTHGHSFRVAKYAVTIGRQLMLSGKELNDLEIAAYMHDLGKIGISESILGKPGKLTNEEFFHIQQHPVFTDKILQPIHLANHIIQGAIQHHERLDGTGYPMGLSGPEISLFGRIIAVADVFDALTSKRPYRDAMPVETALKILCNDVDKQFDRNVVLALLQALQDNVPGSEFSEVSNTLKFDALQNLNLFLKELTEFVATPPAGRGRTV
ncbi:HD-GYP domain-containing protein [Desulfurivibrio alkaliphilus]|uniref:Metal dependent phosphohydrolase n=1 Tax=Desulfurivibrio alkaliphilus (strain DSM 19089 / UNIQEM U267 / AHT2) TaxID=589865 RepID=D6Z0J0_DESAT|nr:HD-GYP domain-containing protein [Desulfurivibrio alkaliphilus]ADH85219.1 metal dependent phosphohydrolase [Desulfurivibrio alkaliphilus AHT 2]